MHLLNTSTRKIQTFLPGRIPPYVILSHRWEDEEVSYNDLTQPKEDLSKLKGWAKLDFLCSTMEKDGWEWVWMDTCCIDKGSSAELSEAINSMYQWYSEANFCIAYLADILVISAETEIKRKQFHESEWFKRGWTLQELLASCEVVFYDKNWNSIGTRSGLKAHISRATSIRISDLYNPLGASVAAKMSWASRRQTSRPEDIAYCLLGLFGVNMPLLYGEGEYRAFQRLQYEIVRSRRDESIFAWTFFEGNQLKDPLHRRLLDLPAPGLLAPSPQHFSGSGDLIRIPDDAEIYAPQIRFDGLVWTMERSFIKSNNRKWLAPDAVTWVTPLACAKRFSERAPVKLELVTDNYSKPPHRESPDSLEFFSESEMQSVRHSKPRRYDLIQEQPQANSPYGHHRSFRHGFTLRLSEISQWQCFKISKYGPGVELQTHRKPGEYIEYIISASEKNRDTVGIVMRHEKGAAIDIACHIGFLKLSYLELKINMQRVVFDPSIDPAFTKKSSENNLVNLGDCATMFLEQGQHINVASKHGRREGQNEIVLYMDRNAESSMDRRAIFSGDIAEGTVDNADVELSDIELETPAS